MWLHSARFETSLCAFCERVLLAVVSIHWCDSFAVPQATPAVTPSVWAASRPWSSNSTQAHTSTPSWSGTTSLRWDVMAGMCIYSVMIVDNVIQVRRHGRYMSTPSWSGATSFRWDVTAGTYVCSVMIGSNVFQVRRHDQHIRLLRYDRGERYSGETSWPINQSKYWWLCSAQRVENVWWLLIMVFSGHYYF